MLRLIFIAAVLWFGVVHVPAIEPERSVVQIYIFMQKPDWTAPWRYDPVQSASGSGFVIKGKRIMTNAHVVSWSRQIIVRKYQDPRPYLAKVEFIGHDCDLAVLKVEDESFFDEVPALDFGELPEVRSTVITYGYPAGGREISYTRGVVSRIEMNIYSHIGNRRLLSAQTDAAINPGNSGGPVIQDERVVGVAFQGIQGLENTGFFIPPPIVNRFLKDIEDGTYDRVPMAGANLVTLQNPAYRAKLRLPDNNSGARVDVIRPQSPASEVLRFDDVVLRVDQYPVANDGTILYQGNRVSSAVAFQLHQSGDRLPVEIWREGQAQTVNLKVEASQDDQTQGNQFDVRPRYYIFGGLVFTPLSLDYLRDADRSGTRSGLSDLNYELFYHARENPDTALKEPVVLSNILNDPVNATFLTRDATLVNRINGIAIEQLEDVVRAFESSTQTYDVIELGKHGTFETLNHTNAAQASAQILKTYGVPQDRNL